MQIVRIAAIFCVLAMAGCMPGSRSRRGARTISVYAFSIMKESLETDIYPAFAAKWKRERGETVVFNSSYAGSETVTNQILQGAPADLAILSIENDVRRLEAAGFVSPNWSAAPQNGIANKTAMVILVRPGNPFGIKDFRDLAKPGLKIIHPDPVSSGGAQWSILAIYGSELRRSADEDGSANPQRALDLLKSIWKNVISTPGSAREARTQFETGYGDALVTYEIEGLLMKQSGKPVEMIVPRSTIFSEHPAAAIDRNISAEDRDAVYAFRDFLWSDEAQAAFVKNNLRSAFGEKFDAANRTFSAIDDPFSIEFFGGWPAATANVIDGVFREKVKMQ